MSRVRRLIVTCDEPPAPPLTGHNRKSHDVLLALARDCEIHAAVYPRGREDDVADYWRSRGVTIHPLARRRSGRYGRMAKERLSLPTVTRDFPAESRLVRELGRGVDARLLIDFISGAPLLAEFQQGTVLSGHDCMSRLFAEESRHATRWLDRWRFRIRRVLALNAERRFAHLAERLHLVSGVDATAFLEVNPRVRPVVIPIGGPSPRPECLRPCSERWRRILWGSLNSELIGAGILALAKAAEPVPEVLRGWEFYGRWPRELALARYPAISRLGLEYHASMKDVGEVLGQTSVLLLPDVGGTGQKNRTMDGLAHGCCVLGLSEVFRGIEAPKDGIRPYVEAPTMDGLIDAVLRLSPSQASRIGEAGARIFEERFSLNALARQWRALLESMKPLTVE